MFLWFNNEESSVVLADFFLALWSSTRMVTLFEQLYSVMCWKKILHQVISQGTKCRSFFENGKFLNETENADKHHQFNLKRIVLKRPGLSQRKLERHCVIEQTLNLTSYFVVLLVFLSLIYTFCSLSKQKIHRRDPYIIGKVWLLTGNIYSW